MPKNFLFISPANLTTNPRLAKELKFAVKQGHIVDFVGFKLGGWSDEVERETISGIHANFHYLSALRKPFFKWFFASLIEKLSQIIYPFFKNSLKICAYAHSKRSFLLHNYLKKNKNKYDLIIAHVLPTIYPAYKFAKKTKTPFIFDVEDYHPGEHIDKDAENEKKRREFLMSELLPKAHYVTYASPLIREYTLKLLKNYSEKTHLVINNCFSQNEFQFKENNTEKIKFVWFSQNIAHGRGLELILPEIEKFKDKIEVTLIGNLYRDFYNSFLKKYGDFVKIVPPMPQKQLNLKLSEFDVGLAIELKTADFNRDICLTNKIWAYFQAGLYIFATDTKAQQLFLQEHPEHGIVALNHLNDVERKLVMIIQKIDKIRGDKQKRFEEAKKFSWEVERQKLLKIWQ